MNTYIGRFVVCAAFMVVLCSASVWAQATAAISGTARDQSGGVLQRDGSHRTYILDNPGFLQACRSRQRLAALLKIAHGLVLGYR